MTPENEIKELYDLAHELVKFHDSNEFCMTEEIACAMNLMAMRIEELERDLKAAIETIEDVCIGTALQCPTCNQYKPCCCDKS